MMACGGGSATPTSPTPTGATGGASTPPPATGATITGQMSSAAASSTTSGVAATRLTPVATISVLGTSISSAVDGSGRFTLSGVPAGTVQLRFSGPGTDATLSVNDLRSGDTVSLTVAVNGTLATVLADSRNPASAAAVPINGVIDSLTGSLDAFEFRIGSQRIRGDAITEFYGHPNRTPAQVFARMNGLRAEVKAWPRGDYWYAERLHVNLETTTPPTEPTPPTGPTPPTQDTSASIEGTLTSIGGSRPNLVLVVAGVTVRTSASTEVQRRGDRQDLSVLRTGMTIHVVGDRRSDRSIDARRLQIKDDAVGAEMEIEGSLGGLKGSCPAVSFGVNGVAVSTTASTQFSPACSELKSGNKVRVRGTRQSDGSLRATSVMRR
jgi:hypothetical protein